MIKSGVFVSMKGGKFNIRLREHFFAICLAWTFSFIHKYRGLIAGWRMGVGGRKDEVLVTDVTGCKFWEARTTLIAAISSTSISCSSTLEGKFCAPAKLP